MKKIVMAALTVAMPVVAVAKGDITGRVVGRGSGEPIEFALVQLVSEKTGKTISIGANTDENGDFILRNVPDGNYSVQITLIGNVPQSRPVKVSGKDVSVGTVQLSEDSQVLKEVVVEGVKGQMRFELDKKVFNVDSNIAAAGASASELLEAVPSVEVDQDGEVSLRGNSSVTIWLNGKESGLTADNRAQILEQIPAETIERIEVITNPSAKYSPEGTAGIINIVLKKDRRGGYFGSAEIGANSFGGGNVGANINYNTSKWDTYAGVGFRMRSMKGGSSSRRDYDNGNFLYSDGDSRNRGNNVFMRAGATYHLSDKNDIYANAFGMFGHHWGHTTTDYISNLPEQWSKNLNLSRNSGDMKGVHTEAGYIHRWNDNHTIDAMVGFNHWGGPMLNSYAQAQTFADETENDVYQEQSMDMKTNSVDIKIDYTNRLNSWLKMEAGFQGQYSHENTPVTTLQGTSAEDMTINPDLYNRFIYDNDINAAYVTLGGKVEKLSFSAGLRAEHWQTRTKSLAYGQSDGDVGTIRRNDFALFPSAFISYSLPSDNEVQINYTRRIRRPWGGQLNSFRNISDPTNISYGNPDLEPQYSNAFELNYIKSWTWHIISLSAYLRTTENDMNRISYLDGDIMYSTWANVGTQTNTGCEIVGKNTLFGNRLDITTTVNLYNSHVKAWEMTFENQGQEFPVSGVARNNFSWDVRCMASVRLPLSFSFQATGRYNSRRLTAQGSREPGWTIDAGLRKTAGNWSFSLNCRDIFDSRKMHGFTYGQGYAQESERWRGGRRFQLTVKYSFGNMKPKPDKRSMQGEGGESDSGASMDGYMDAGE